MSAENILDTIMDAFPEHEFLIAEGFDDAIVGINVKTMQLIYSSETAIDILSRDMLRDDAKEYFEYNVLGSFIGDNTPIWCDCV